MSEQPDMVQEKTEEKSVQEKAGEKIEKTKDVKDKEESDSITLENGEVVYEL